ncbi:MAG: hypothetical protein ACLFVD_02745 [Dehalococcoidia bacterium]
MNTKTANTKDKGYHIRNFPPQARRMAKSAAAIAGLDIGTWIARAVTEKFARDLTQTRTGGRHHES